MKNHTISHRPCRTQICSQWKLLLVVAWISLLVVVSKNDRCMIVSALVTNQPVSTLLQKHSTTIAKLKNVCQSIVDPNDFQRQPYCNDVFYLRYCLDEVKSNGAASSESKLRSTLQWRMSEQGTVVCQAAVSALEQAMAGGSWKNEPVLQGAPHADFITKYITPACAMTTVSNQNDLVYCIRAGNIDDVALMSSLRSIDEMVQFFLYAKEINSIVANIRSQQLDKLLCIITCNDLSNVKLIGGSADFRKALSTSSTIANDVYAASYSGPTLLLNLPVLVSALVQLFTPLFPKAVKERLKFKQGPLKNIQDLRLIASSKSTSNDYQTFMKQLDELLYTTNT